MPHIGWLVQIPFYFLELLVGLVQALVFMLLTAVFTLLICQHHEKERPCARCTRRRLDHSGGQQRDHERRTLMTGNLHVGLAALGAAIAVGIIGMKASEAVGTQSRRGDEGAGPVDSGHRVRRSDRLLRAVPRS